MVGEMRVKLFERPLAYYRENKVVITEDGACFVLHRRELDWPPIRDILGRIFDLGDPEVCEDVERRFSEGRMIVGYYYPRTGHVTIVFPEGKPEYVQGRIEGDLGDV
jgi:hypothetical protein